MDISSKSGSLGSIAPDDIVGLAGEGMQSARLCSVLRGLDHITDVERVGFDDKYTTSTIFVTFAGSRGCHVNEVLMLMEEQGWAIEDITFAENRVRFEQQN